MYHALPFLYSIWQAMTKIEKMRLLSFFLLAIEATLHDHASNSVQTDSTTISFWIISIRLPAMNSPKSFSVYSCGPILTLFLLCDHRSGVAKDCCSYHSSRSCTGGRWSRHLLDPHLRVEYVCIIPTVLSIKM